MHFFWNISTIFAIFLKKKINEFMMNSRPWIWYSSDTESQKKEVQKQNMGPSAFQWCIFAIFFLDKLVEFAFQNTYEMFLWYLFHVFAFRDFSHLSCFFISIFTYCTNLIIIILCLLHHIKNGRWHCPIYHSSSIELFLLQQIREDTFSFQRANKVHY